MIQRPVQEEGVGEDVVERVAAAMAYWSHQSADIQGRCWVYGPNGQRHSFYSDVDEAAEQARLLNARAALSSMRPVQEEKGKD